MGYFRVWWSVILGYLAFQVEIIYTPFTVLFLQSSTKWYVLGKAHADLACHTEPVRLSRARLLCATLLLWRSCT